MKSIAQRGGGRGAGRDGYPDGPSAVNLETIRPVMKRPLKPIPSIPFFLNRIYGWIFQSCHVQHFPPPPGPEFKPQIHSFPGFLEG